MGQPKLFQHDRKSRRRGAALIELAVCLPLIVLLTMATIEACSMLYMRQSLKIAAFEACRVGLVSGAKTENVLAQSNLILASRKIVGTTTRSTPANPLTLSLGQTFQVRVSAPCNANAILRGWFFEGKTLTESVSMIKDK